MPNEPNRTQSPELHVSIWKIIKNDRTALLGAIFPPIALAAFIFSSLTGIGFGRRGVMSVDTSVFAYVVVGMTIFGIALLVWRVRRIKKTFTNCEVVSGSITGIAFFRDRGRVDYSYELRGKTYTCGNAIMKNRITSGLRVGDQVDVLVDRSNPTTAYIRRLYE